MPKERTHWHLARRAAGRLTEGQLADAVLAYPEHLLLGAVSHDTGYYALGDPQAKAASDRAHGTGGDSYERFRALLARKDTLGAPGLAFGFGALTHLAADVVFHPLVFSWTGDAEAPDRGLRLGWLYRHQACETALDVHLEAVWGLAPARLYGALLRRAEPSVIPVVEAFLGGSVRPWITAHHRFQGLFHRGWARLLARAAAVGHPGGDGDWSAAFYGLVPRPQAVFEGTLTWVDPVTGEPGAATLNELVGRFDALVDLLGAEWEAAWLRGGCFFPGTVGPALDTGVRCDRPQAKRHFAPKAEFFLRQRVSLSSRAGSSV